MKRVTFFLLSAVLAGCAGQSQLVSSSDRTIVVRADGVFDAQPLAQAECKKQKLNARWQSTAGKDLTFSCEP